MKNTRPLAIAFLLATTALGSAASAQTYRDGVPVNQYTSCNVEHELVWNSCSGRYFNAINCRTATDNLNECQVEEQEATAARVRNRDAEARPLTRTDAAIPSESVYMGDPYQH